MNNRERSMIIELLTLPWICGIAANTDIFRSEESAIVEPTFYTAFDDASWAVKSTNLSNILGDKKQALYDEFINECLEGDQDCRSEEEDRLFMNKYQPPSMVNYTRTGFAKIRAPEPLFKLLTDFWDANHERAEIEWDQQTAYHNTWKIPTKILKTENDSFVGGGWNLSAAVWNAARDILEEWTGQKLAGSSVYGIRIYHNQSILAPHVDRLPLISSAIINVAQDVEDDWFLEVYGHDGKAVNVSMKPGDMILYESHSVIHGRPFPLNGKFYANIFVHFEPMGDVKSTEKLPEKGSRPPYLIAGSAWEEDYFESFPDGWTLLSNIDEMARKGDLYTMRYVAQREPGKITDPTQHCRIMNLAVLNRHRDMVEFLVREMGYDINKICFAGTPLDHAFRQMREDDSMISFLIDHGAVSYTYNGETPREEDDPIYAYLIENGAKEGVRLKTRSPSADVSVDRCEIVEAAIEWQSTEVVEFLFQSLSYDTNMVCDSSTPEPYTPLDVAYEVLDDDHEIIAFLIAAGGLTHQEIIEQGSKSYSIFQLSTRKRLQASFLSIKIGPCLVAKILSVVFYS
ncbi:hypothetical protein ACA910_005869 [Epithemia clementina (nom. ined.)]